VPTRPRSVVRLLAEERCEPEVADVRVLSFGLLADEDVRRLHIPMHEAGRVRGIEPVCDLSSETDRALGIQPALSPKELSQVEPVHELHREVEDAVLLTGVDDRYDVRVIEARRRLGLTQEAPAEALVLCEIACEHLERDPASAPRVLCQIDGPHGALADLGIDAKARQRRAGTNVGRHQSRSV
jgi:hypothetical protein